jgi:hypothetical protein
VIIWLRNQITRFRFWGTMYNLSRSFSFLFYLTRWIHSIFTLIFNFTTWETRSEGKRVLGVGCYDWVGAFKSFMSPKLNLILKSPLLLLTRKLLLKKKLSIMKTV